MEATPENTQAAKLIQQAFREHQARRQEAVDSALTEYSEIVRVAYDRVESGQADSKTKGELVDALMELGRAKAQARDFEGAEATLRQAVERSYKYFGNGSERLDRANELVTELMEVQGISSEQALERAAKAAAAADGTAAEGGASWGWMAVPSQWSWN